MEFISLSEVLCNIAERVQLHPRFPCSNTRIGKISLAAADEFWYAKKNNHPFPDGNSIDEKIEWARKMGVAALHLHNAVLDSPDAPLQWAEFDGYRRVNVNGDLIKKEALKMLEHAIGWGNRLEEKYNNHFRNAINKGDEELMLPVSVSQDEGLTRDEERIRLMQIGCDSAKLIAFLNANDIAHSLEAQAAPAIEPVTPAAAPLRTNDEPPEWIVKSVELANAIGLKKWKDGERQITARNIANAVAVELGEGEPREPQKYHGNQGPRSADAIRSVALKGWKFIYPSGIDGINGMDEITPE